VASLFAALLGYNPMAALLPANVSSPFRGPSGDPDQQGILPAGDLSPVRTGLAIVFIAAAVMALCRSLGVVDPRRTVRPRRVGIGTAADGGANGAREAAAGGAAAVREP